MYIINIKCCYLHMYFSERKGWEEVVWLFFRALDAGKWEDSARWHPWTHCTQGNL